MPRTEARTKTSLWRDSDFVALPASAQRTYWLIYSQPTISLCGVVALTIPRWALLAADTSAPALEADLAVLEQASFIVVDYETQEVLVRSFMSHDGVWSSPKTRGAALGQLEHIMSDTIRAAVLSEIAKLDGKGQLDTLSDTPSHTAPRTPTGRGSDTPRTSARAPSASSSFSTSPSASRAITVDEVFDAYVAHRAKQGGLNNAEALRQKLRRDWQTWTERYITAHPSARVDQVGDALHAAKTARSGVEP
jgi:hypothetical protein